MGIAAAVFGFVKKLSMNATLGNVRSHNAQTQAVIDRLCGIRTKEEMVKEFFGLTDADLQSAERLKELQVGYMDALARFNITPADFEELFGGALKHATNGNRKSKPKKNENL